MRTGRKTKTETFDGESFVQRLLERAIRKGGSDIHFEPHEKEVRILLRIDGVLKPTDSYDLGHHERVVSRLKVLAGLPVYQHDLPQEGRMVLSIADQQVQGRLAVFPTIHGEKVVVRFHSVEGKDFFVLDELGFSPQVVSKLRETTERKAGCLLLTGPSGSGKTTTIYALLRDIFWRRGNAVNIVTLEDPVEMFLDFAVQSEIRPAVGYTFPTALRSVLRQDPEVLMVGEIRDGETAQMAIEAGLTGHLVISTIHSGNTLEVLTRLLDMGIERYLVASSVVGVLNQRLVRKVCSECNGKSLRDPENQCPACGAAGFQGRMAVGELLNVDDSLREAFMQRTPRAELRKRAESRISATLRAEGNMLVKQELTTWEEILRVIPKEDSDERR